MNREQVKHLWEQFVSEQSKNNLFLDKFYHITINPILSDDERFQHYLSSIQHFKGKTVLDAGCGIGFHSCMIALYANKVVGIDINRPSIQQASYFSSLFRLKNTLFERKNISTINQTYINQHSINGIFLKGVIGWFGSKGLKNLYKKCCDFGVDVFITANYFPSSNWKFLNQVALHSLPFLKEKYDFVQESIDGEGKSNGLLIFKKK